MSEKLIPVLGEVLGLKPEEITEKIKTDDGLNEIASQAKSLKVFKTNQEYLDALNAYKTNFKPILEQEIYKQNKTNIHEKIEKEIKAAFPELEKLEYKKDYHSTDELLKKRIALEVEKNGKAKNPEEWEKEKNSMLQKIEQNKILADSIEKQTREKYLSKIFNKELNHAIELTAPTIDVEEEKLDGQKKYLGFLFSESGTTIEEDANGNTILKQNGTILVDDLHKPISLNKFVSDLAAKHLQIKSNVPAGGRGGSHKQSPNGATEMLQFASFDEYLNHRSTSGNPLKIGSKEANEKYEAWTKAHQSK